MKIGLILPANLWLCPYIRPYIRVIEENLIEYEIVCWNKDLRKEAVAHSFDYMMDMSMPKYKKAIGYFLYALFLIRIILKQRYDKLVIFGPQVGIFISPLLLLKYKNKFILDYRDLSIEQQLMFLYKPLLKASFSNVISSQGYKNVLPKEFDYILCHNFVFRDLNEQMEKMEVHFPIQVLTIGAIRDYESNVRIIKSFANDNRFELKIIGEGPSSSAIQSYVVKNNISNVSFIDFYTKEEEDEFVMSSDIMNIYFLRNKHSDNIMSNRLYLALKYKKPIIATKDSIQGDYVEQHNLGISIENCTNLPERIKEYLDNLDFAAFGERCDMLLGKFNKDQMLFNDCIGRFLIYQ